MSDFENKYFTFWKGTFMPKSIHENARSVGQKKTRVRESLFHMPRGGGGGEGGGRMKILKLEA